jgi:hypothetical protein
MMDWLRWHLEGNVRAIVLGALIAVIVVAMAIFGIPLPGSAHSSLGPDWECADHEWGGPTCIKRLKQ